MLQITVLIALRHIRYSLRTGAESPLVIRGSRQSARVGRATLRLTDRRMTSGTGCASRIVLCREQ